MDLRIGAVVAEQFRVERLLAQGGMGAVYVVTQLATGRQRALKVMHPSIASDARGRERFLEEAKVGARIHSDHVVEVVTAGIDETTSTPWLCMELLAGETLDDRVRERGPVDWPTARALFAQLRHGLGAAHAAGIVHRDLKPENLYLAAARREGVPFTLKILDFGIAKLVQEGTNAKTTSSAGTPLWMAPEQAQPGVIGPATDVWACGLIAFFTLTGLWYWKTAHQEGGTLTQLLVEVLADPMAPASERARALGGPDAASRLPAGFDAWLARCLSRDATVRFRNADEAFSALDVLLGGAPAQAFPSAPTVATPAAMPAPPPAQALSSTRGLGAPDDDARGRARARFIGLAAGLGLVVAAIASMSALFLARRGSEPVADAGTSTIDAGDTTPRATAEDAGALEILPEAPLPPSLPSTPRASRPTTKQPTRPPSNDTPPVVSAPPTEPTPPAEPAPPVAEPPPPVAEPTPPPTEEPEPVEPGRPTRPRFPGAEAGLPRAAIAAYRAAVLEACWREHVPTPTPPARVVVTLRFDPQGQVQHVVIAGTDRDAFRRCVVTRSTEHRFGVAPTAPEVRVTARLGGRR